MSPSVPSAGLTDKQIAIIRATLCSLSEFKPDWAYVLKEYGLAKGGHGPRDFRAAFQGFGLDFKNGKVIDTLKNSQDEDEAPAATPSKKTTGKANGKAVSKANGAGNKRKKTTADAGQNKKVKVEEEPELEDIKEEVDGDAAAAIAASA
ncbi:uncharacterized protein AB675_1144 [Cyphellophora attinorum]|uniref:Uncharacterized protein n=1 Tax=Cyphellophora attinorum TaxID=1664694 RepID=A0A0N1HLU2_9EURO|nr:uncharacterized protein AB675_1144 [Phialophora attinorum]KPI38072.1 hypothetical protein AB675_1144 [Phialophora attinorum]